ncbi:MAG: DUF4062 domain-containing protein [bacterium]|nr:DUF4062 domain-containing protein [bacterium]
MNPATNRHQAPLRMIRVFISSTFNDMHEERNELVKFIFPELRKICERRHVTWGEVDLRWGIPDEAKAEGKVLPICLEEIKRCRPYFIGILGERYGWIPETLPFDLVEKEHWLRKYAGRSVTELEILHGVLENPAMKNHAYFYFRDPKYISKKPTSEQNKFRDTDAQAVKRSQKLKDLKERIRQSKFPVQENYPNPKAFGQLVLEDFKQLIDKLYPEDQIPDALTREASEHEVFAESRRRLYIGGEKYSERLNKFVAGTEQPLVVLGESGSGKSALLANWVAHYREHHPNEFVMQHFIGATGASADWTTMVRRIIDECNRKYNVQTKDIPGKPEELRSFFANFLYMTAAKGRVVLVIDAVNQLEDRDQALELAWLPPVMPANIRLIVSTLPGKSLDELKRRKSLSLEVKPLDNTERVRYINDYLKIYSRELNDTQLARIASAPQATNPLFLKVLLEELRLFGKYEELDQKIGYYLQAQSIPNLYQKVLIRWEQDYEEDSDLVGDAISLLWSARWGLSEIELLDLLGENGEPLPRAKWSPLYLAASDSLVSRSGLLGYFHDYLRDAVRDTYIPTEEHQRKFHVRIADYFLKRELNSRKVDELPWQLCEAKEWDRLYDMLADLDFFDVAWNASEWDVKRYWANIETNSSLRMSNAYQNWKDTFHSHFNTWWKISVLLGDTGNMDTALQLRQRFVSFRRNTGDKASMYNSLVNLALILYAKGNLDEADSLNKEAEQICRELGDKAGLSTILGNQALILMDRGDLDSAMALCKEQERISRELGNKAGLQHCLCNQALILQARGDLNRAMALLKEQERISRELGDKEGLSACFNNQANILSDRGDLAGAMALHKENERLCRELGNKASLQLSLGNQATILLSQDDLTSAMFLMKEQERLCRELGAKAGLSACYGNQALILKRQGDLVGAMALHKEEERICRELGNKSILQGCLCNQALILKLQGDLVGAMELHKEAERLCREIESKDGLQASFGFQASILMEQGDLNSAMSLMKEQERLCRELGSKAGLQASLGNQAMIFRKLGDFDRALTLFKEKERLCRELGDPGGIVISISQQAILLTNEYSKYSEALPLVEEAYAISTRYGYTGVQKQLEKFLSDIKSRL